MVQCIQTISGKAPDLEQVPCAFAIMYPPSSLSDEIVPKYTTFSYTLQNYHTLGDAIIYS
jgi:hypothetical protein